jgi:hypothetical protein
MPKRNFDISNANASSSSGADPNYRTRPIGPVKRRNSVMSETTYDDEDLTSNSIIRGTKLKFTNSATWTTGVGEIIPPDREFIVWEDIKAVQNGLTACRPKAAACWSRASRGPTSTR